MQHFSHQLNICLESSIWCYLFRSQLNFLGSMVNGIFGIIYLIRFERSQFYKANSFLNSFLCLNFQKNLWRWDSSCQTTKSFWTMWTTSMRYLPIKSVKLSWCRPETWWPPVCTTQCWWLRINPLVTGRLWSTAGSRRPEKLKISAITSVTARLDCPSVGSGTNISVIRNDDTPHVYF